MDDSHMLLPSICPTSAIQTDKCKSSIKNEAEIADDLIHNARSNKLPVLSPLLFVSNLTRRKGSVTDVVERDLRCLYQNIIEERKLLRDCGELYKQSLHKVSVLKQRKKETLQDYQKLIKKIPDIDDYMINRKSKIYSWQAREREGIYRRYCSRDQPLKAPPQLKEQVEEFRRSHDGDDLKDLVMTPLSDQRSHSIGSVHQTCQPQHFNIHPVRRMTIADIPATHQVDKLTPGLGPRVYISDFLMMKKRKSRQQDNTNVEVINK